MPSAAAATAAPPQAPYMFTDYSLSSIIPPFASTEMLDRSDKSEKDLNRTEKRPRHRHRFSSFIHRITDRSSRRNQQKNVVPRVIYINQHSQQKFLGNQVSTAKYNPFSFLPKFLYVEFSKSANLFFLFISGIQVRRQIIISA
jgi:hypothetical protein